MKDQFDVDIKLTNRVLLGNNDKRGKILNYQYGEIIGFTENFVIIKPENPDAFDCLNPENRNKIYRRSYKLIVDKSKTYKDSWLRLMAEMDNYKKNVDKQSSINIQNNSNKIILNILDIIDDLERAIDNSNDIHDKDGILIIYTKFLNILQGYSVKQMEIIEGQTEFNPDFHEAISIIDNNPEMKNKIITTIQKGYLINDKILRVAKVIIGG